VSIVLNSVNSGSPPTGLTTTVVSSITPGSCPCNVSGPLVPPGSDSFTFTTYDQANGGGNELATDTGTYTITAGSANTGNSATLLGIPKFFGPPTPPVPTLGVTSTFNNYPIPVEDADYNTISGTYATPVTVSDSDTFGSLGVQLTVNGGAASSSVTLTRSTDVLAYIDGGIADAPTLSVSAAGATTATVSPAAAAPTIAYSGPLNGSNAPEVDLYATTGTGSQATFSASESGWTPAPYDQPITATTTGCGSIGTVSPSSGTSFTFSAVASPVPGSCTIKLMGGVGNTVTITATYTSSAFGVN
jgi:hypothetical protein